jgi:uncharacterized sporulation protein YeaH/YhbH (DUF444 family)
MHEIWYTYHQHFYLNASPHRNIESQARCFFSSSLFLIWVMTAPTYNRLKDSHDNFALQKIAEQQDIYPVFREFFQNESVD